MPPRFDDHQRHALHVVEQVRRRCDPVPAMRSALAASPARERPSGIIAAGKAAWRMAGAFLDGLAASPPDAVIVEPAGDHHPGVLVADHPIPTRRNLECAAAVQRAASRFGPGAIGRFDCCAVLLSGGASACLALPVPEVSLDDLAAITRGLLLAGAAIEELNTVRRHLEVLKGGGLAAALAPMPIDAYLLSDVIGDAPHSIASGPCAPDPTTFADALAVLDRYGLRPLAPGATAYLEAGARGQRPETRKPGDPLFDLVRTTIVASNATAVAAAADAAAAAGFDAIERRTAVVGNAADAGRALARRAIRLAAAGPTQAARAIVWGGETTVPVGRAPGVGGRNQELALAAAIELAGIPNVALFTFATDGVDGPTDAAGAIVTGRTIGPRPADRSSAAEALARHDSHTWLARHARLIRTGPTGTNVNDLAVAMVYPA
jgi:hydroxypyruvate reductase